jgi:DNA (cytosine-5)-methyltransferase 1
VKEFTFIDLFSGIGGFKIALSNQGGVCKGFSEINKDAIETYCENFNEKKEHNFGDIKKIKTLPSHDILTAGVPCQSWSIAGRNLGFDDDRGQLWNDTIYLLKQSQPKAFIFENVKGLVDPRNKEALDYILTRIKQAGYHANYYVLNSFDYGVPQSRVRVYIIGFKDKEYFEKFALPKPIAIEKRLTLSDILGIKHNKSTKLSLLQQNILASSETKNMSLSSKNGYNDYFLFNDLRNGHTTIHSWDILDTTDKQKAICSLLLKNRRKSKYGKLDGNPLSLKHFQELDDTINIDDINALVRLEILKEIPYAFKVNGNYHDTLSKACKDALQAVDNGLMTLDTLKTDHSLKLHKTSIVKTITTLMEKNLLYCHEIRFDFKNTKISTGLFGVNRIFLPSSDIFPTLVASDSNDYVALQDVPHSKDYKNQFLDEVYKKGHFRKITKKEACLIQGFPANFKLPESRNRWMKLVGNSVSIPVVETLCSAILKTGMLNQKEEFSCKSITIPQEILYGDAKQNTRD